jgi:hypothetical protein
LYDVRHDRGGQREEQHVRPEVLVRRENDARVLYGALCRDTPKSIA